MKTFNDVPYKTLTSCSLCSLVCFNVCFFTYFFLVFCEICVIVMGYNEATM